LHVILYTYPVFYTAMTSYLYYCITFFGDRRVAARPGW
jgi:hypothetical protein